MTVNLTAGGGIEGFISTSDASSNNSNVTGAFRTVGSNVAFNVTGAVTLGQNLLDGINGLDNGRGPTSNSTNIFTGTNQQYHGVILELKGVVAGTGSLTKQGHDIVTLSGANTYSGGTLVSQGVLRTGAAGALPSEGNLTRPPTACWTSSVTARPSVISAPRLDVGQLDGLRHQLRLRDGDPHRR